MSKFRRLRPFFLWVILFALPWSGFAWEGGWSVNASAEAGAFQSIYNSFQTPWVLWSAVLLLVLGLAFASYVAFRAKKTMANPELVA